MLEQEVYTPSSAVVDDLIDTLYKQFTVQAYFPTIVFGISRGGIVPAVMLAARLGVPMKVCAPGQNITSEYKAWDRVLVVDDIYDSGATLEYFKQLDANIVTAVLYVRPSKEKQVTYFGEVEDQWVRFPWETGADTPGGVQQAVVTLLRAIGEDPLREGLQETPARVEKAYKELSAGYSEDIDKLFKTFAVEGVDQVVVLRDIPYYSLCEHHMLPFWGTATIAYIPDKRVIGVSKLARIVTAYSRRLQVQERMTQQIADTITNGLNPLGVAVLVEGEHLCMRMRGIEREGLMRTQALTGVFRTDAAARAEVLQLMKP